MASGFPMGDDQKNVERHVYLVDDDAASRESLRAILELMQVQIHEFETAEAILEAGPMCRPACLVTDQRMPGMGGVQLVEEIRRRHVGISIIVMTAFPDTRSTVRVMQSKALTLLEKPCNPQELWDAIQLGLDQDHEQFLHEQKTADYLRRLASLNAGEVEVLELIVQGHANKIIAKKLEIGLRTVEGRRANVFDKMRVESVPELTLIWHMTRQAGC